MRPEPEVLFVRSATPPTVEVDSEAMAAYIRFKKGKVARTVSRPSKHFHLAVDLDRNNYVLGIEVVGATVIQIGKILEQAAVKAPEIDYSQVRYVPAEFIAT